MKYLTIQLIEYIVVHELAHLVEMGHNKKFWNIISNRFNDYKKKENELLIYWLLVKDLVGI
jgi:predicted metal-dependent hydrolase